MADNPWGTTPPSAGPKGREWELLEKVVMASVDEQRRARRWSILFRVLTFAYLTVLLWLLFGGDSVETAAIAGKHTAVVSVQGEISEGSKGDGSVREGSVWIVEENGKEKERKRSEDQPFGSYLSFSSFLLLSCR